MHAHVNTLHSMSSAKDTCNVVLECGENETKRNAADQKRRGQKIGSDILLLLRLDESRTRGRSSRTRPRERREGRWNRNSGLS